MRYGLSLRLAGRGLFTGSDQPARKKRYEMPWIEKELDPEFETYIKDFANDSLTRLYELIEKYGTEKQVIIFKSRKEADDFLNKM